MKTASVKNIKDELKFLEKDKLIEICLRLSRFKKDNKELLTYLLFESDNEEKYIQNVRVFVKYEFSQINNSSFYLIKKSVRKILRQCKKYIRYSPKKATEVEILLFFLSELSALEPSIRKSPTLLNLFLTQKNLILKRIEKLHEDLQYDYRIELEDICNF